jgi:hypothetical protein
MDRPFEITPGGNYDENGFYYTPNGSFWDPDGVHFNREGIDRHGGFYDEELEYHPGPGWIEELMCYDDEKDEYLKRIVPQKGHRRHHRNEYDDLFDDADDNDDLDDIYEDLDIDKVIQDDPKHQNVNQNEFKVYKPHMNYNVQQSHQITANVTTKSEVSNINQLNINNNELKISPDLLFNKIPDNLKQEVKKEKQVERQIQVDSLFK